MNGVPATPFDQRDSAFRCEWGAEGVTGLARAAVIIVVDVLRFTTCVDVAVGRGAAILPYGWKDATAVPFAAAQGAQLAGAREDGGFSLSPASYLAVERGVRVVLPSPNGARLTIAAAATGSIVLAGCLRNASAVAAAACRLGSTINVCPAGERWPDGSLRPALEDWLAAGAILRRLPGAHSVEAMAAIAAFEALTRPIASVITDTGSGRELITRGFADDVELATDCDCSDAVPRLDGAAYAAWSSATG